MIFDFDRFETVGLHDDPKYSSCSAVCKALLLNIGPQKVIEIGTSYGLGVSLFGPEASSIVCIDVMYDWVPDVREEKHEKDRVDENKVKSWIELTKDVNATLIIGNARHIHSESGNAEKLTDAKILLIDGCHSPAELVKRDYTEYERFLVDEHFVIWDDIKMSEVKKAAEIVFEDLVARGYDVKQRGVLGACIMWITRKKKTC